MNKILKLAYICLMFITLSYGMHPGYYLENLKDYYQLKTDLERKNFAYNALKEYENKKGGIIGVPAIVVIGAENTLNLKSPFTIEQLNKNYSNLKNRDKYIDFAYKLLKENLEYKEKQIQKNEELLKNQPKCCKQKADGISCKKSDECRGSCNNGFLGDDKCQNQTKYCDISKCIS